MLTVIYSADMGYHLGVLGQHYLARNCTFFIILTGSRHQTQNQHKQIKLASLSNYRTGLGLVPKPPKGWLLSTTPRPIRSTCLLAKETPAPMNRNTTLGRMHFPEYRYS